MNDLAHQQLAAIRERLAKATPGAKYVEQETRVYSEGSGRCIQDFYQGADFYAEACGNAEFFAHGWCDIDFLLTLLADAERRADEIEHDSDILLGVEWQRSVKAANGDPEAAREHRIAALVADLAEATERAEEAVNARQAAIVAKLRADADAGDRNLAGLNRAMYPSTDAMIAAYRAAADAIERGEFREKS